MKSYLKLLPVLALSTVLFGCSSPNDAPNPASRLAVSSGWLYPALYPSGAKFALIRVYPEESSLPIDFNLKAYQRYGIAIEDNLRANGYIQVSPQDADFYVRYGLALNTDVSDEQMLAEFGISSGLQDVESLDKASLLIYMQEPLSERLDYRAIAQGFVREEPALAEDLEFEQRVVSGMLTQFYQK